MDDRFDPDLRADQLPKETLIDLWQRTAVAHQNLCDTWHDAVSAKYGADVADVMANSGWPKRRHGESPRVLFFDDLKFAVFAVGLRPDMLTVADRDQAEIPQELRSEGLVVRAALWLAGLSSTTPRQDSKPAWIGAPPRLQAFLRGKGLQLGFPLLLKIWRLSQNGSITEFDVEAFVRRMSDELDTKTLALLWNCAALAYMLVTDRWYTEARKRFGAVAAQELEKDVWIDRGAAEYDLDIGLKAVGATGTDVENLLRGFQFAPGEVGILNVEFELKDKNRGILTHHTCPALDRFEHFDDPRLEHCCEICIVGMPISGEMLTKKIKCKPLKLPPRLDANDIACRWEYELMKSPARIGE